MSTSPNASTQRPPIVLIHGLWVTPLSWERWTERYSDRGYPVLAPAWPGLDGDLEALRADPTPVERLGIAEIVDHYDAIIRELDAPPIIIGHSFGGAFTEILLDRGLGAAGVAIDAAAVKGITKLPPAQLKSAWPVLKNPANRHRAVMLTPEQFHYAFTNTMSEEDSRGVYERYAVPGPGRVLFQGALANFNPTRSPRPPPSTSCLRGARTSRSASRGGRRSPTTPWSGPRGTRGRGPRDQPWTWS
jgi:pimeloyl-ACP methyl ester carboxylesterase